MEFKNVTIHESNTYDNVHAKDYSVIISNPPIRAGKEVVHRILAEAYDHLVEGRATRHRDSEKTRGSECAKENAKVFAECQTRIALDKEVLDPCKHKGKE